ncbi:exosortase-associated protein EpsI, B-type [Janthinobacterium sp. RT4P48]|jgi:EpsI family protein|uniref:exosortase-associated protein EpsI, B-type n=1 Tax=Janthinobacterium sp. RT4P48 TaxID=3424188 RepID=UPI003F242FE9
MKRAILSSIILGVLMAASAGTAKLLTPTHFLADKRPPVELKALVPTQFGAWREETQGHANVINPSTEDALKAIYTQTLSRTYINNEGYRVMLSIAYGANQSDGMQLHYPEVCYPAQGFELTGKQDGVLATPQGDIKVKRLQTNLSRERYEPVTYWSTVGDVVVRSGNEKKMAEMRYRLAGDIPDGLLFRVSSLDTDTQRSFAMQEDFVNAMVKALPENSRRRLMGFAN